MKLPLLLSLKYGRRIDFIYEAKQFTLSVHQSCVKLIELTQNICKILNFPFRSFLSIVDKKQLTTHPNTSKQKPVCWSLVTSPGRVPFPLVPLPIGTNYTLYVYGLVPYNPYGRLNVKRVLFVKHFSSLLVRIHF